MAGWVADLDGWLADAMICEWATMKVVLLDAQWERTTAAWVETLGE